MKPIRLKVDKITSTESEKGTGRLLVLVPVNDLEECGLTLKLTEAPDKFHSIKRLLDKELARGDELEITIEPKNTQTTLAETGIGEEFKKEVVDELEKKGIKTQVDVKVTDE